MCLCFFFAMSIPPVPFKVIRYQEVESTNSLAVELGVQGAGHGTVVHAIAQTGGRGRQSREFSSPPGGLYLSIVLRPSLPGDDLPLVTLAAGIAAAEIIEVFSEISVQLKWPNDLYVNGKKLGGILTEAAPFSPENSSIPFVVTGIGVNVNTPLELFPGALQDMVTSLYCQSGQRYAIDDLIEPLIRQLLAEVENLAVDKKTVLSRWQQRDFLLNKRLKWQTPQGQTVEGVGAGLLPDGRYNLKAANGEEVPVLSGDIVLTEIDDQPIK